MTGDFDSLMVAHAKARGPVRVIEQGVIVGIGRLLCWRPTKTRRGSSGDLLTRSIYVAVVELAGNARTYPLNRYDVEPIT